MTKSPGGSTVGQKTSFETPITRKAPSEIGDSLKEAVAEGILNDLFRRLSGAGGYGEVLYRDKPSTILTSAFLMPSDPKGNPDSDDPTLRDEEISPIRITSCGIDFKIGKHEAGKIIISPKFSIYVRVLPNEEDLRRTPVHFRIDPNLEKELIAQAMDRLNQEFQTSSESFGPKGKSGPIWKNRKWELIREVGRQRGAYAEIADANSEEGPDGPGVETPRQSHEICFIVGPGAENTLEDSVVQPVDVPLKWKRLDVDIPDVELDIAPGKSKEDFSRFQAEAKQIIRQAVDRNLDAWIESSALESGGRIWAHPKRMRLRPSDVRNWAQTLAGISSTRVGKTAKILRQELSLPDIDVYLTAEQAEDWLDPDHACLRIALENRSSIPVALTSETEESVFRTSVIISVPRTLHRPLRLDRVKPSYRWNIFLDYPALGLNCGVKTTEGHEDRIVLETTWMPIYYLPRVSPTSHDILMDFATLKDPSRTLGEVKKIPKAFDAWIDGLDGTVDTFKGLAPGDGTARDRETDQFEKDKQAWRIEADLIRRGVATLEESAATESGSTRRAPFDAWIFLNETMEQVAGGRYPGWRLFQAAFILANIPAFASRITGFGHHYSPEWDEEVSLLYFPTGGGKSEAFFGLLTFCLFLDRLRGKSFGVTAMLRYPLRLLTIQQAQRASTVLAQAEIVRCRHGIDGESFSLGFWVGSSNTPNQRAKAIGVPSYRQEKRSEEELRTQDRSYRRAVSDWLKLPQCPFCGNDHHFGLGLRRFVNLNGLVGHVCFNPECWWNKKTHSSPLPFYIVDEDIYAVVPSVLLGTIDKLALIGQSPHTIRKIFGMFGFGQWHDPKTRQLVYSFNSKEVAEGPRGEAEGVSPCYEGGVRFFDPLPCLIVQDEAHLLEESLGTFSGLFETTLMETFRRLAPLLGPDVVREKTQDGSGFIRLPKVVLATATVSEPQLQAAAIYQKKVRQFPHPGPTLYESFYAGPEAPDSSDGASRANHPDVEVKAKRRRVYASLLTNGKPHTSATSYVLAEFHHAITTLYEAFRSGVPAETDLAKGMLIAAQPPNVLGDLYKAKITVASTSELATLIDLHRVALSYVTNKKGGDQVADAEEQETLDIHMRRGPQISELRGELITGSVDIAAIQATVRKVQGRRAGDPFQSLDEQIRSVIATSAVSHGVDVEELNSMFFVGVPTDIAEYIQASSRVGRTHVGICILIPIPQRRRDRYITEIHEIYHRFLERMVLPAAVDRWAENAILRVIPSFLQTWFCGVKAIKEYAAAPASGKARARNYDRAADIGAACGSSSKLSEIKELVDFICEGIGLYTVYMGKGGNREFYRNMIEEKARSLVEDIIHEDNRSKTLMEYFRELAEHNKVIPEHPMTSLRDVDVAGQIRPQVRGGAAQNLSAEEFQEIMRFLRRGGGATMDIE